MFLASIKLNSDQFDKFVHLIKKSNDFLESISVFLRIDTILLAFTVGVLIWFAYLLARK